MFKQITDINGNEWYLIASLWIFLIFFIIVAILLVRMKKDYIDYMGNIPLEDDADKKPSVDNQNDVSDE